MPRLMTNELMSHMNLRGNGAKIAFGKTQLYKIIIGMFWHVLLCKGYNLYRYQGVVGI